MGAVGHQLWIGDVAGANGQYAPRTDPRLSRLLAERQANTNTVVIVVNMDGSSNPNYFSSADADNALNVMFHDSNSVNNVYQEGSLNKLSFPDSASGNVIGPISIAKIDGCPVHSLAGTIDAAAGDLSGYHNKIYLEPPQAISDCSCLASAEVGYYGSSGTYRSCTTRKDTVAIGHEAGHNLGWHHAATDADNNEATDNEYGDTFDMMGYCCSKRKFNSVHLDQVG